MSKPAAGYTRLSQDGISIENQKTSIRDYCRTHDLDLTSIYNDGQHASGYPVDERPEYQVLRERVRNQDVRHMALSEVFSSSLSRQTPDFMIQDDECPV